MKTCFVLLALLVLSGCKEKPVEPAQPVIPLIHEVRVSNNSNNVLSAIITLRTSNGAEAAVEVSKDSLPDHVTPFVPLRQDSVVIPVLGLRPNSRYLFRVVVKSPSGYIATNSAMEYTTQPLPNDITIPPFTVVHSESPTVKYIMLGIAPARTGKSYAVIIDNTGGPVWYKEFRDAVVDFQKQPNGRYTAWSTIDGSPSCFQEFDALGAITNRYRASSQLETGPHELRMQGTTYVLFGIEYRMMDMTAYGGLPNASVKGLIVEWHRSGQPVFLWNTFDHFDVTDAAPDISLTVQNVNPWHGNAIEIDSDGNLLVSFRNMDEITKINAQTGAIMWRLGGRRNQFTFRNDNLNGFSHQHGVRRLPDGNIILFDNGNLHSPQLSRAVEYRLDEVNKTAELVWEYRPNPPLYGFALGFAQRLTNGNTLICFGIAQHIIEVDQTARKRWEVTINEPDRYAYRAFAIESLY